MAFDINNLNVSAETYRTGLENLSAMQTGDDFEGGGGISTKLLSGIAQAFQGITALNDSAQIALDAAEFQAGAYRSAGTASKQGADFQAKVYRQAGKAALVAANYNIALEELQLDRQEESIGQELNDVISSNWARTGASGLSMTSKSVMMVQSDVMSAAEKQFVRTKNDTIQRQQMIKYQGQLVKTQYENEARAATYSGLVAEQNYENQARAAEYQGKIDAYKAKSAMTQQIGGAVSNIFGMFGG